MKPSTYFRFPERNQRTLEQIRRKVWYNDAPSGFQVDSKSEMRLVMGTTNVKRYAEMCMVASARNRILSRSRFQSCINDLVKLYGGEVEREHIQKVLIGLFSGDAEGIHDGLSIDTGKSLFTSSWSIANPSEDVGIMFGNINTSINEAVMFEEYDVLRFHTREEKEKYEKSENKCWAFALLGGGGSGGDYFFGLIIESNYENNKGLHTHLIANESGDKLNFSYNYNSGYHSLEAYHSAWNSTGRAFIIAPIDDVFLNKDGGERIVSYNHHRGFKL